MLAAKMRRALGDWPVDGRSRLARDGSAPRGAGAGRSLRRRGACHADGDDHHRSAPTRQPDRLRQLGLLPPDRLRARRGPGFNCRFLQGEGTDPKAVAAIRAAIENRSDIAIDLLNYRKSGEPFWNGLYLSPVTNAAGELQFFFASQLDVTDRVSAQQQIATQQEWLEHEVSRRTDELREALATQTMLVHEVDHRVKNNIQMISALLSMQAASIGDPAARASLDKHAPARRVDRGRASTALPDQGRAPLRPRRVPARHLGRAAQALGARGHRAGAGPRAGARALASRPRRCR